MHILLEYIVCFVGGSQKTATATRTYKNGIVSFNIQLNAGIILRNSQVFAINFHRLLYYISQRQSNAFDVYYYYYVACLSVAGLLVWCGVLCRVHLVVTNRYIVS